MTGTELLTMAIGLFGETDTTPYAATALPWINFVITETFDVANRRLAYAKLDPLLTVPLMTSLDDPLPYDDTLTLLAFPYGLATHLFRNDENDYAMLNALEQKYAQAVNKCDRAKCEIVKSKYDVGGLV